MKTMSSRCGIIGSAAWPELHRRAAALGPPVNRLDAVREEDDAQPQRRRVRLDARQRSARTAAAIPSTAAPARRPRRAENDDGTGDGKSDHAHRTSCARLGGTARRGPVAVGAVVIASARLRNWRLVTIFMARSENVALPPAAIMSPIERPIRGQDRAARARIPASSSTASS